MCIANFNNESYHTSLESVHKFIYRCVMQLLQSVANSPPLIGQTRDSTAWLRKANH